MLFSQLRRQVSRYATVICFVYVVAVLLLVSLPSGRRLLDSLGQDYIATQDAKKQQQAEQGKWQKLEQLGNISRHHRYAPLKTRVLQDRLQQGKEIKQEHLRWANKNKRNIPLQLMLADYYERQGKPGKSLKLLQKLYNQVPDHPQLKQAYLAALAKRGHAPGTRTDWANIEEYFAR